MKPNIQIKFLTLDEMSNARNIDWRYEHVGIDNLGFADKTKNRVFVRAGLEPELTKYLIDHELEHLFEMEGTDEDEHGIRHKKKGGFMRWLVPMVMKAVGSALLGPGGYYLGSVAGSSMVGKPDWGGNAINSIPSLGGSAANMAIGGPAGIGGLAKSGNSQTGSGNFGTVGNPGNGAISFGAGSGIGEGIGGEILGSGISPTIGSSISQSSNPSFASLFSGALGAGMGAMGGSRPTSSSPSFRMPDFSQQANANPSFSGWGEGVGLPDVGPMGGTGSESLTNSRGMGGLNKMPINPGLGQAGVGLSGQSMSSGFGQGINRMFQGQEQSPMDFNNDFGNLSF